MILCGPLCTAPLHGFGVDGQAFAIDLEIILIHYYRPGIYERGHRRCQGRAPIFKLAHGVVVKIVEEL